MNSPSKRFRSAHTLGLITSALFLSSCATIGPPQPPSLELPKPPTDLRASRKGDKVLLTWTIPLRTTDRMVERSVGPTLICRGRDVMLMQCGEAVGHVTLRPSIATGKVSKEKSAGSYSDELPGELQSGDPAATVTYAIEVRNADGRSAGLSNQVHISSLRAAPPPELRGTLTKDGVVLKWSRYLPGPDSQAQIRYVHRLCRRAVDDPGWVPLGDFPAGEENDMTVTDSNIEWEKTYSYRIETVSEFTSAGSEQQIEGDDSPEVKVFAHDIFPPAVPGGLQAVFSGPGQNLFIDLIWAPVTDADLEGYNIYRHEEGGPPMKVNAALVKAPAFRDESVAAATQYFYSVTAVDVRGNESARSEETGERVP